jgi:hypothetical protein
VQPESTFARCLAFTLLCLLVTAFAQSTVAVDAKPSIKSEIGQKLLTTIEAGIPFDGMSASLDGASVWPGYVFFRLDNETLEFDGHLEWTSLNHVNYIEGTITETGNFVEIDFTSTTALVKGSAATGVDYHLVAVMDNGQPKLLGRWNSGNSRGPFEMIANPEMAGKQSSLLDGRSVDELLGSKQTDKGGKPKIIYQNECLDWKIDGFEYPNGDRFFKLSCNWARDRLADGPSTGEMMIIITSSDPDPLLGFRHDHGNWEKNISTLDHIDIYFSEDVQYSLPIAPQDNGWAYSTDPAMVKRIITSADRDAQHIDSDMIIYTGLDGIVRGSKLNSYISTKGLKVTRIQGDHFLKGEEVPSCLDIMERLGY